MEKIDFTKEEREIIAEFVYGYEQDILIVSDAEKVLEVLNNKNLIDNYKELVNGIKNKNNGTADAIMDTLFLKIADEQGNEIMNEYMGVKTN